MSYKAEIPYKAYWSTPFAKWQGSLAHLSSVELAAYVAKGQLAERKIEAEQFEFGVLGFSVPQKHSFYGLPWLAAMVGANRAVGPTIGQACATSVRVLSTGTQEIETGNADTALLVTCDRTSNGPHLYYPNPRGPGGTGAHEDWVMDNFSCDPNGGHAMINTAENVAAKHAITTEEQHDVVMCRTEQYSAALRDERAFQKCYMVSSMDIPTANFRKTAGVLDGDEGITLSTVEGLARLRPVVEGGTVTFGGQTHPADGNASIILATADKAREMSADKNIRIKILGFGSGRAEKGYMPEAIVPAARRALAASGLTIGDMVAINSHNPFALNDIYFSREMGFDVAKMNNYGCSLIWGHPQGPTGMRSIIELIEELVQRGGGYGMFEGCAAGDTAMAVVIHVGDGSKGL
ncbi:MAG: thiolase family protein [Hyphomicrobiales bacterium]|nr:thiolase family protein [Hyphomicrobiales bacterium]